MKILIGCEEICGLVHTYKKGFEANGHDVTTIASDESPYFDLKYDFNPYYLISDYYFNKTTKSTLRYLAKIANLLLFGYLKKKVVCNIIDQHDCYIYIWRSLYSNQRDLKWWSDQQKKIFTLFMGSDIRNYKLFFKNNDIKNWNKIDKIDNDKSLTEKKLLVKRHEKYSSKIFSVPDQSQFISIPYHHLQIPLALSKYTFVNHNRRTPIVIHAPSKPHIKGTDIIVKTVQKLKSVGVNFEFRLITGMKNVELIKELVNADILLDEIILNGPAVLSYEALACGCAVATKCLPLSPSSFKPPVVNIDKHNIFQKTKNLIENVEFRKSLIKSAKKYIDANNETSIVTKKMLDNNLTPEYN